MRKIKKIKQYYFITMAVLLICFLFQCNYNDSVVDPNSDKILLPLFTMKGIGDIDTAAVNIQKDLTRPLFCLFWSKDTIEAEAVVGMTTKLNVSFPLRMNIDIFDLPTRKHLYNPYLYEDSTSLSGKYFEFGIAILVIINDSDGDGNIDPILFDSLEIAFEHNPSRDWIAGIAEDHLIIYLSNTNALEWVYNRNLRVMSQNNHEAQWLHLDPGYNLVAPYRVPVEERIDTLAGWDNLAEGYKFDGFIKLDHTTEFINIKLVDDPNNINISHWGNYFPKWWIWREKDLRFITTE